MIELQPPQGFTFDPERLELHRRAMRLVDPGKGIDYLGALAMLEEQRPPPYGYTYDPASMALHERALRIMAPAVGLDYIAAVHLAQATMAPTSGETVAAVVTLAALSLTALSAADGAGFKGVAYSGGIVPNFGFDGDMAIDLATMAPLPARVAVLRNHDANQIVGHASLVNDGAQLRIAAGRFSPVTAAGREAAALLADGHPWNLSIGVNGHREHADRARPVMINGRRLAVDTIMRRSRLLELSFVPSGADPHAAAAAA